jgi:phosphoglycerate dehydrogenase-like enzyme
MHPKIIAVMLNERDNTLALEMAPKGFDVIAAAPGSAEYAAALKDTEYLVGFVDHQVKEELYKAAPKLRLIQLLSAGYDRADIAAARKHGVPVCNNGGANSTAVSEHAILLMQAVSRRLIQQHANVSAGRWRGNTAPKVHEVRGKTMGIVGLGTIGKKTARLALGFGMKVIYYDIERLSEDAAAALGVEFRLLSELLREADVVSLHTPLNASTRHMIGANELALLKPDAILVNTSRGPVIDEQALIKCLSAGKIFGAGLDVFDREPPPQDNALFQLDNVVLTAHLAGPTQESFVTRLRNGYDNVQRVARGAKALWVIEEMLD